MRFFDKRTLLLKVSENGKRRSERVQGVNAAVLTHYAISATYLGDFYYRIAEDANCSDILTALANASEEQLDSVDLVLIFFWFYARDRICGDGCLSDKDVLVCLAYVWGLGSDRFINLVKQFDTIGPERIFFHPLMVCYAIIDHPDLSPLFVAKHLRDAFMKTIREKL